MLNSADISASEDEPESILDALLQCAVCEVRRRGGRRGRGDGGGGEREMMEERGREGGRRREMG